MKRIVLHCSATPNSEHFDAEDIHQWHLGNGWDGIGYHHVIVTGGEVQNGRPHFWTGSHVKGMNTGSIGICLIGEGDYTEDQEASLIELLFGLTKKYPEAEIVEHRVLDSHRGCPLFDRELQFKLKTLFGKKFVCKEV